MIEMQECHTFGTWSFSEAQLAALSSHVLPQVSPNICIVRF